jgi:D-arabinose 1-dehydrogenase-like Zn-dependent alcohol dehydrogenase
MARGAAVRGLRDGDRVCSVAGKPCGTCLICQKGSGDCPIFRTMGVDFDGAWADQVVVPAAACVALPDAVPFPEGAILADAVATPYAAIVDVAALRAGERVAVLGIGGLGTHAVQLARLCGAGFVVAVDPRPAARARALALGADLAVALDEALAAIRAATGDGVDVSLEMVGDNRVLKQATAVLAPHGRCVLVGVSGQRIELGPSILFASRRTQLLGSYGYTRRHLEELASLVARGRLALGASISARLPLERAPEGVRMLIDKTGDPVRILLEP